LRYGLSPVVKRMKAEASFRSSCAHDKNDYL
jgi:hypothetical protein